MELTNMDSLLIEKYAWVDQGLEELYYRYALTAENCDEFQDAGLLKEKWAWVDRKLELMMKNESELGKRKRNESLKINENKKIILKNEKNRIYYEYDLIEDVYSDDE